MKSKQKIVSIIIAFIILLFANISLGAGTATITVETARLRESPSQDSSILELISLNEEVEILGQEGEWYQVRYNGITGYLRNDLLKVTNQNTDNTNTETNEGNTGDSQSTGNTTVETNNTSSEGNTTDQTSNQTTQNTDNTADTSNTATNETTSNEINNNVQNENTNQETEIDITGKYTVSADTNLKIVPLINSLNTGTLQANNEVEIDELINGWAHISNDTIQGWIRYDNLVKTGQTTEQPQEQENTTEQESQQEQTTETKEQSTQTKYVNTQTVNVRREASTSASIVTQININTEVEVLSEESGWYRVRVNGVEGYVATTLLSDTKQETSRGATEFRDTTSEQEESTENDTSSEQANNKTEDSSSDNRGSSNSSTSDSNSNTGSAVLAFARQYLGYPYVYGGASPSGFDCSGFTSYVYKHFGVSLNRTAAGQASNGKTVKRSELQVGDLVMFCSPINHVGIYAGNNQIIHAANKTRGVVIDTISSGYYNTNYNCARRIF